MGKSEIWKPIKGYEGMYEISNKGNVKSIDRIIEDCIGRKKLYKGKILKKEKSIHGYYQVPLYKNGKAKLFSVHRLVAYAFIENPKNLPFVNHIDFERTNNNVDNLEWVTPKENVNWSKHRMVVHDTLIEHPKTKTNSGEHHIRVRKEDGMFNVTINHKKIRYTNNFANLNDAISWRDNKINELLS